MTTFKVEIGCDYEGCDEHVSITATIRTDQRAAFEAKGWTRHGSLWLCPESEERFAFARARARENNEGVPWGTYTKNGRALAGKGSES